HARALGRQFAYRTPESLPRLDVQAGGRLVQEQQPWASAQGQRELDPTLLATGQLAVAALHQAVEACKLHALLDAARIGVVAAGEVEQLAYLQGFLQRRGLQHHADAAACRQPPWRLAEQ